MNKEKISTAIGEIADRHIEEALDYENRNYIYFRHMAALKKAVACIVFIIASLLGAAGIAFTANADFRNAVVRLLSSFSEDEKLEIRNGHMTTNLDMEDTLIEFVHNFNDKDMGHGKKVKYGDYTFLKESADTVNVIVNCESDQYKLLVNIKGEKIDGVLAWKVASYQLISSEKAEEMLSSYSSKPDIQETEEPKETKNPMDSVIKASKNHAKIYNTPYYDESQNIVVNKKVVSLSVKETKKIKKIFDEYQNNNNYKESDGNLIILFDDERYLISEDGLVLCSAADTDRKIKVFKMTKKDIKKVLSVFNKYQILN